MNDFTQIIQSLSNIYSSIYYIDLADNSFIELSSVADVHTHIGSSGNAQERPNYFCHNMVTPEFKDELLPFVDLVTLEKRLGNSRIISKQYRTALLLSEENGEAETWRECSFIEGDHDADGRLAHVLFTTQSIHSVKVKELEAKEIL